MPDLIVPVPNLRYEALMPGVAAQEKPVEIRLAPAKFPDGSLLSGKELISAGFLMYRQLLAGAPLEVWDAGRREWRPEAGIQQHDLQAQALAFMEKDPLPWQGLLVALGQTDQAGQEQFSRQVAGFPRYNFRARFTSRREGQEFKGLSSPSPSLSFGSLTDQNRAGIAIVPDGKPVDATLVRLFLRDAQMLEIGAFEIFASSSGAEVQIRSHPAGGAPGAVIRLLPNGEIRLEPATGQRVVVNSDLETERITYRPAGGGAKQTLP